MNKELIIEALEALKKTVEFQMDANDAHFSTFFVNKINAIDNEIEEVENIKLHRVQ